MGFVTLTGLPALGWHRSKRDDDQLPRLPLPIRGHPARRVAVLTLHAELPGCGGSAGRAGIIVSYETIRRWVDRFGPLIAADLRRRRCRPHSTWHLDEMVVSIGGRRMYLWRAVDAEGEILDVLVQARRDTRAARRLMLKLVKRQGTAPSVVVTDRLSSYGAAFRDLGLSARHVQGKRRNNRAESSHVPIRRRERKMQRFRSPGGAQRFLSSHATVCNLFNHCRHLTSARTHRHLRGEAMTESREAAGMPA
jgi:putative transposase